MLLDTAQLGIEPPEASRLLLEESSIAETAHCLEQSRQGEVGRLRGQSRVEGEGATCVERFFGR